MAFAFASRQAPAGGFSLPQSPMQRSASPMARMAVGSMSGAAPNQRISRGPGSDPMSNQFQYSPAQYSQDVESSFDKQLGQNAKEAAMAQQTAENYGMSVQRRNASNAAIGGYSVGGGGFLAGQTNALLSGQANAAQLALGFNKNATDIEARRADYRAGVDKSNTDMANKYAYDDWVYNRGRTDTLADKKADADATAFANDVSTSVADWTQKFDSNTAVNVDGSGQRDVQFMNLIAALRNAKSPKEKAAAEAALQAYYDQSSQAAQKQWDPDRQYLQSHGFDADKVLGT